MGFSPSSSCSSTSFSANFCTSKGSTLGCFSGFFSRILSSKIQQTYPSDIQNQQLFSKIEKIVDGSNTPNVVARLMGLEFMPEIISKDDKKDCNSMDFREETEEIHLEQKRVKTSFSFRETPNYFELEGDNFLVLSFEDKSRKNKKGSSFSHNRKEKCRKKQRRNREEQGKNRVFSDEERLNLKISPQICQNFENDGHILKQSYHLYPFKDKISGIKEEESGIKARKKKKKENCLEMSKGELECELLENYSPVSVLDDSEFISDLEVTVSSISEEDAKSRGSECDSRELSSSSSSNGSSNLDERTTEENEEKKVVLKRRDYRKHENIEMLRRISKLAEVELSKSNSKWKYKGMFTTQDFEDCVIDFSQHIFDNLINELIDQLVRI